MKMTHCLTVATGLALLCSSCAKQDAQTSQPVKQPAQKTVTKKAPRKAQPKTNTETQTLLKEPGKVKQFEPPAPSSSSSPFRAPVDDIKLPTDAEMAEGKESAASKQPSSKPNSAPSISVKPPASAPQPGTPQE